MKNTVKLLGLIAIVAVIGFSFTACEEDGPITMRVKSTNGTLTISGLGEWNGKYVWARGNWDKEGNELYAAGSVKTGDYIHGETASLTLGKIQNGTVSLKVWENFNDVKDDGKDILTLWTGYKGNDSDIKFSFYICENSTLSDYGTVGDLIVSDDVTVNFTNGSGIAVYVKQP